MNPPIPDQVTPGRATDYETGLSPDDLSVLLEGMRSAKVAVTGDFCLDAYWHLDEGPEEESIETGLPVRRVTGQRYSPGGAGNVVANLVALGVGEVRAIGIYGDDPWGPTLVQRMAELGADTSAMVDLGPGWQTLVYAKPYYGRQEQNRLDFGTRAPLPERALEILAHALGHAADWADAVVVNQQVPACFADEEMVTRINGVIASHPGTPFIVDSRVPTTTYVGASLKLNVVEAFTRLGGTGPGPLSEGEVVNLAGSTARRTGKAVFVTRGEHGIVAADPAGTYVVPGIEVDSEVDPVGAGDTVVAAIAAVLACGGDARAAAYVANMAASVTVRKLGETGTATAPELVAAAADAGYVYAPELAEIPAKARLVPGTQIEIVVERPRIVRPEHVVFDFDGTLSTLREGWEQVMEQMMVAAILGDAQASVDASTYASACSNVRELIDRTTGMRTVVQMEGLSRLVRQWGYVPDEDILDGPAYKEIYGAELAAVVRGRLAKIAAGQLERSDFLMKNAVQLLQALTQRGAELYVASGSDQDDVRHEADALGLAGFFQGRIHGAVAGVNAEAKRVVLDRILADNDMAPQALVTIGDGPAEMRETRRRGGVAVGVCSDERRRFGANPAKRRRLVRGGATIVVPDFTDIEALLAVLGL